MFERTLFAEEHVQFRESVRRFLETEVLPFHAQWEEQGYVDREVWRKAGAAGFLCPTMPEEFGGAGVDRRFSIVLLEEMSHAGATGLGFGLHSEVVAPYLLRLAQPEAKARYLKAMATGESIGAIAMTEPFAGSDLQGIRATAVRDGDHYVVNGSKTFVTNGWHCDIAVIVAKTDPAAGAKGVSLFVVDGTMPGFSKGKPLKKMGMKAQDTAELFFDNVRVPAQNRLGDEGRGFAYLMQELAWERLQIALMAVAAAEAALEQTIRYTRQRTAFGSEIIAFQNTRFVLAEIKTQVQIARVFVDRCTDLLLAGKLDAVDAAMAKYWTTELQCKVMDACVQLHGGYGFMWEYPIARAYVDARAQPIYGGTNEIMKEIIGRSL